MVFIKRTELQRATFRVVGCTVAISFVIGGWGTVFTGILIDPLMREFGWSDALASGMATAFSMASLLIAPAVGLALDRLSARYVVVFGILCAAAGPFMISRGHNQYAMTGAFALAGIGYCASFYVPSAVIVTYWMQTRRSLGMGAVLGGTSLGAALASVLIGWDVEVQGWRSALAVISAITLLMLPCGLLIHRCKPSGMTTVKSLQTEAAEPLGRNSKPRFLTLTFILVSASGALSAVGMGAVYYHVIGVLLSSGFSARVAGCVFGATWILSALGSLGLGAVADRRGARKVLSWSMVTCACGTLFLIGASSSTKGLVCIGAFAILWGASANGSFQFLPVILAEHFGSRGLGALVGVQSAVAGITGASAPIATGLLYDRFGNYAPAILLSTLATLLSMVLLQFVGSHRRVESTSTAHNEMQAPI
jgi:MFS family permease